MAYKENKQLIYKKIKEFLKNLEENQIKVWRLYLYGSYTKNTYTDESDHLTDCCPIGRWLRQC